MFDGRWRHAVDRGTKPMGRLLVRARITADVLTAFGLVMSVVTAFVIGSGHLVLGILLLFPTGLPDLFDGPVAKASGTASVRGAFLDSVADRISDAFLMGGIAWYLVDQRAGHDALLPFAILGATSLISYQRAKAELLGLSARGGLMERRRAVHPPRRLLRRRQRVPRRLRAGAVGVFRAHPVDRGRAVREGHARRRRPRPTGRGGGAGASTRRTCTRATWPSCARTLWSGGARDASTPACAPGAKRARSVRPGRRPRAAANRRHRSRTAGAPASTAPPPVDPHGRRGRGARLAAGWRGRPPTAEPHAVSSVARAISSRRPTRVGRSLTR